MDIAVLKLALIGKNISHSKSQSVYEKILGVKICYDLIDIDRDQDLPSIESLKSYDGVSITSPYKEYYLNEVNASGSIRKLNAINCINPKTNEATNTDLLACKEIMKSFHKDFSNREVVLYGSGAMARVVEIILTEMKVEFSNLSRKKNNFLAKANTSGPRPYFVINCLSRKVTLPIELNSNDKLWDLNYLNSDIISHYSSKPEYFDGEELLYKQAEFAVSFWNINYLLNS